jgi:Protein of unknown function (DUF3105)
VPNAKKGKPAARRERVAALRAQQKRAERRRNLITIGAIGAVAALIIGAVAWYAASRRSSNHASTSSAAEVIPPGVGSGVPTVQGAVHQVPNTSGIPGVVEYVTAGWPQTSRNGPKSEALSHDHVTGPVRYSVSPPVGGPHNATWMNCGIYDKPVPSERAVHNLEHGAIWITYQPSLPQSEERQLRAFVDKQTVVAPTGGPPSRFMDLTPYPGLPAPIVISSWGFQLKIRSPADPRLQLFVNKFRASARYTPEYGAPCTGGLGTPLPK